MPKNYFNVSAPTQFHFSGMVRVPEDDVDGGDEVAPRTVSFCFSYTITMERSLILLLRL